MPLPQWRDVNAPNFSGAADSLQMFSQLLNQGLGTAKSTFREFDQSKSDEVNRAIEMQLAQIQDPDQARAQAAAILAGANKDRISSAMISAIGRRPGEVQQQALTDMTFNKTRDDMLAQANYEKALTANQPLFAAFDAARKSGDEKLTQTAYANLAEGMRKSGVTGEQMLKFTSQMDNRTTDGLAMKQGFTNFARGNVRWDQEQLSYTEDLQAKDVEGRMLGGDFMSNDQRFGYLKGELDAGRINGRQFAAIANRNGLATLSDYGMGGGAGGGTAFPGATSGGSGDFTNFLVSLESGGNATAKNSESSATGLHQFTDGTWLSTVAQAQPGWAKGMSRAQLLEARKDPNKSAEMETALRNDNIRKLQQGGQAASFGNVYAMHHFGATGGMKFARASGSTPVSQILSPDQIKANPYLAGKTKDQVLANWTFRTGTSAAQMIGAAAEQSLSETSMAADYVTQNFRNSLPETIFEKAKDNSNSVQVAAGLAKAYNLNPEWVETAINKLIDYSRSKFGGKRVINAAVAGQIIQDNFQSRSQESLGSRLLGTDFGDTFSFNESSLGNGKSYNLDFAKETVDGYISGKMDSVRASNQGRKSAASDAQNYSAQAQALEARIQQIELSAAERGQTPQTGFLRAQLADLYEKAGVAKRRLQYFAQYPEGRPSGEKLPDTPKPAPKPAPKQAPKAGGWSGGSGPVRVPAAPPPPPTSILPSFSNLQRLLQGR